MRILLGLCLVIVLLGGWVSCSIQSAYREDGVAGMVEFGFSSDDPSGALQTYCGSDFLALTIVIM